MSSGADGKINCGTAASSCGPAAYAWRETVTLTATPDAGNMLGTWAGDCSGRDEKIDGKYACVLDTRTHGADKFVAAVFGEDGRTLHGNFDASTLHGTEFLARVAKKPDTFDCTYCHATTYGGLGIAPSCNGCHAAKGHPGWLSECNFCHGAPPPTTEGHPATASGITGCTVCHSKTVDGTGKLIAGGPHMDGMADASGHGDYTSPALHGPKFFDFVASGQGGCTECHGTDYASAMNPEGVSCNGCHTSNGWTSWSTNCSFCHGDKNTASQLGNYELSLFPMWSAPTGGAHQAHLVTGATKGGRFTAPFACETCHTVPADVSHISGAAGRATVTLTAAGRATLPASLGDYDPTTGTCTTYCHGVGAPSPAWTATAPAFVCGACHGLAPAPATGHPLVSGALTGCALCHDATMNADGTIDLAAGTHIDGQVQAAALHGDYRSPAVHGPKFFGFIAGAGGDCRNCHGANDDGGVGPSCNACHSGSGWTSWQSNCSFCHGERNATSQEGGYDLALFPMWSAPDVGAHEAHLTGRTAGGLSFAKPFKCETCHPVPSDLSHIGGAAADATVALAGAGQATLPVSLGSYDATTGSCSTYCHGTAASPAWLATGLECGACHGLPPASPHPSVSGVLSGCSSCHSETVKPDGTLDVAGGKHLDGVVEKTSGHSEFGLADHGAEFFSSLAGTSTYDCKGCHGSTYAGGTASSCDACHASAGWANWQTNCSFCHGTRSATTKAGYSFAANPAWAAPPETVSGLADASRTGAHQVHLSGVSGGVRYECATCHVVPATLAHAAGPERAPVTLSPAGQGSLPQNLGTYDASAGTCTTYCHGSTLVGGTNTTPAWSAPAMTCTSCHGDPPPTGRSLTDYVVCGCNSYVWSTRYNTYVCNTLDPKTCTLHEAHAFASCTDCHSGAVHVNGATDVGFSNNSCATDCHGDPVLPVNW